MANRPFPIDFRTLKADTRPRRWLVLPPQFDAAETPDQISPVFALSAPALMAAFGEVALAAPRTALVREGEGQAEYVQRSRVFRFPDYITVQAFEQGGGAALAIYSRAVIGYSDIGVNRKRIQGWLAALEQASG